MLRKNCTFRAAKTDTEQLCSYCTADLRLYFRMGKNPVVSRHGSNPITIYKYEWDKTLCHISKCFFYCCSTVVVVSEKILLTCLFCGLT